MSKRAPSPYVDVARRAIDSGNPSALVSIQAARARQFITGVAFVPADDGWMADTLNRDLLNSLGLHSYENALRFDDFNVRCTQEAEWTAHS
jgi:hypothetical protein